MALEPVNERPIFPTLIKVDVHGIGGWSVSMIRQLTTVFQQYGYRLNRSVLAEPSPALADLDDVPGRDLQIFTTSDTNTNLPAGVTGWGLLIQAGRLNDRRVQLHIDDAGDGTVPNIHLRVEGSSGFGNWYEVTLTEVT